MFKFKIYAINDDDEYSVLAVTILQYNPHTS